MSVKRTFNSKYNFSQKNFAEIYTFYIIETPIIPLIYFLLHSKRTDPVIGTYRQRGLVLSEIFLAVDNKMYPIAWINNNQVKGPRSRCYKSVLDTPVIPLMGAAAAVTYDR